jgi:hypothetical protein
MKQKLPFDVDNPDDDTDAPLHQKKLHSFNLM